jgi:hypothetical protein
MHFNNTNYSKYESWGAQGAYYKGYYLLGCDAI